MEDSWTPLQVSAMRRLRGRWVSALTVMVACRGPRSEVVPKNDAAVFVSNLDASPAATSSSAPSDSAKPHAPWCTAPDSLSVRPGGRIASAEAARAAYARAYEEQIEPALPHPCVSSVDPRHTPRREEFLRKPHAEPCRAFYSATRAEWYDDYHPIHSVYGRRENLDRAGNCWEVEPSLGDASAFLEASSGLLLWVEARVER
jgi:hypothetical protein